jgi:hypothetical protein
MPAQSDCRSLALCTALQLAAVAGAVAIGSTACTTSDQDTVETPKASSRTATTSTDSQSVTLFSGKTVLVSHSCAVSHDLSSRRADAVAAARQLPSLERSLVRRRRRFRRFLAAHPERNLSAEDYARYKALRARYRAALTRYNRSVAAYNRLADRFNAALKECKID